MTEVCWLLERWPQVEAAFLAEVARGTLMASEGDDFRADDIDGACRGQT
jgi:hypothetical protein